MNGKRARLRRKSRPAFVPPTPEESAIAERIVAIRAERDEEIRKYDAKARKNLDSTIEKCTSRIKALQAEVDDAHRAAATDRRSLQVEYDAQIHALQQQRRAMIAERKRPVAA